MLCASPPFPVAVSGGGWLPVHSTTLSGGGWRRICAAKIGVPDLAAELRNTLATSGSR